MLERLIRLSERMKHAPSRLIKLFDMAYKLSENDDIVKVLCSLLIKENQTDEKYFVWYR